MVSHPEKLIFLKGSSLEGEHDEVLKQATVVFMDNTNYNNDFEQALLEKFLAHLPHGTRLITLKELFPGCNLSASDDSWPNSLHCHLSFFDRPWFTGEPKKKTIHQPVKYHVYTVNKTKPRVYHSNSREKAQELWKLRGHDVVDGLGFVCPTSRLIQRRALDGERRNLFETALRNQTETNPLQRLNDLKAGKLIETNNK